MYEAVDQKNALLFTLIWGGIKWGLGYQGPYLLENAPVILFLPLEFKGSCDSKFSIKRFSFGKYFLIQKKGFYRNVNSWVV